MRQKCYASWVPAYFPFLVVFSVSRGRLAGSRRWFSPRGFRVSSFLFFSFCTSAHAQCRVRSCVRREVRVREPWAQLSPQEERASSSVSTAACTEFSPRLQWLLFLLQRTIKMQATIITGMYSITIIMSWALGRLEVCVWGSCLPEGPLSCRLETDGHHRQLVSCLSTLVFGLVLILRREVRARVAHDGGGVEPSTGLQVACDAAADGPVPGHCWSCAAAALGNAFPGAEPASGRQRAEARYAGASAIERGPWQPLHGASARGLPPEADERVAGFRTGVDVPAAPTPF